MDLDGTLLGTGASLLRGADGAFALDGVRALQACWRADVEVVLFSGRRQQSVFECARLIGSSSYIFELGCGLVLDGELQWLTDGLEPSDERGSIFDQIEASGAPALLSSATPSGWSTTRPGLAGARSHTCSGVRSTSTRLRSCSIQPVSDGCGWSTTA